MRKKYSHDLVRTTYISIAPILDKKKQQCYAYSVKKILNHSIKGKDIFKTRNETKGFFVLYNTHKKLSKEYRH